MSRTKSIVTTCGLALLALSFPAALFLLNAPALDSLGKLAVTASPKPAAKLDTPTLEKAIEAKVERVREFDERILQARGEIMKFEELKEKQLDELESVRTRISELVRRFGETPAGVSTDRARSPE